MNRFWWMLSGLMLAIGVLGGCNNGGSAGAPVSAGISPTPTATPTASAIPTVTPTFSSQELYVENSGNSAISFGVFPSSATGNIPPTRSFTVANVGGLSGVARAGYAFDSSGNMYVGNAGVISVFPALSAMGTVTPTYTLTSSALLPVISGLAFDSSGNLYAATYNPNGCTSGQSTPAACAAIAVFGPGAQGNATPLRVIAGAPGVTNSTTLGSSGVGGIAAPQAVAVGACPSGQVGQCLYVAEFPLGGSNLPTIVVFSSTAMQRGGNVAPMSQIQGSSTGLPSSAGLMTGMDLAVGPDPANNNTLSVYVAFGTQTGGGMLVFPVPASGNNNVPPSRSVVATGQPALVGTSGIALDPSTNEYMTQQPGSTLLLFGIGASGPATPVNTLAGPNTNLAAPLDVRFGP